jgi:transposase InsO family protein
MPWKEHRTVDLRKEFVLAAASPGANVAQLCREHEVSRKTAYKWLQRYRVEGESGLDNRSRRPRSVAGVDGETVLRVIELRRRYPVWGAKKLRHLLVVAGAVRIPSAKTIARILDRAGEPRVRKPRRLLRLVLRQRQQLVVDAPNDVWTVDFKGWWRTRDKRRFEPLTVRDAFSRYVISLRMLGSTRAQEVKAAFEELFERHGLPSIIRVDNGAPFACTSALGGLSRLSAWWTSVGIRVSFSRPAHPQDNGGHERMHADVAAELESSPADDRDVQQRAADSWRRTFNQVRPHEALGMKTPADLYVRSPRRYRGIRLPTYPKTYAVRRVTMHGCVRYLGRTIFVSESLAGYDLAVRRSHAGRLAVRFYDLPLGFVDFASAPLHHPPHLVPARQRPRFKRAA